MLKVPQQKSAGNNLSPSMVNIPTEKTFQTKMDIREESQKQVNLNSNATKKIKEKENQQKKVKPKKYQKKQKPMTQQQIEVFRQAFQIFDSNHSGSIDQAELTQLMSALGYHYNDKQIKRILQQVDQDGSGVIQIDQFVQFMSKHMLDTENIRSQIVKVFDHFDDDSSGFLDFKKIKTMVGECFFNIDNDAIKNMIESADTDGDMKISRYEFMRIMKKVRLL